MVQVAVWALVRFAGTLVLVDASELRSFSMYATF